MGSKTAGPENDLRPGKRFLLETGDLTVLSRIGKVTDDPAEDSVETVEPGSGFVRDEKLAAVGVGAAVRHAENPRSGVFQIGIQLVGKAVSRASRAVT